MHNLSARLTRIIKTLPLLAIATFTLMVPPAASAQGKATDANAAAPVEEEMIKQIERDRQAAFVARDLARIEAGTAEDYTTINPSGRLSTKPEMMRSLRESPRRVLSTSVDELKARIYGDTAVLTGRLLEVSETAGQRKSVTTRFTRVLVRFNDKWQTVAYQATEVAEK